MSDRWLGRSEGEEIDDWNTVHCSHIQGNMSTCETNQADKILKCFTTF